MLHNFNKLESSLELTILYSFILSLAVSNKLRLDSISLLANKSFYTKLNFSWAL